jgi:hypothetical protein
MVSISDCSMMERRPRAPVLRSSALRAMAASADGRSSSSTPSMREQLLVLLDQRIAGLGEDANERVIGQLTQRGNHGQPAHKLRNQPELDQVFGLGLTEEVGSALLGLAVHRGSETDARFLGPVLDDLFQSVKRAAADEEDVCRVDLQEVLIRMLAPALRWHAGHRAFDQFQQCLLHALA